MELDLFNLLLIIAGLVACFLILSVEIRRAEPDPNEDPLREDD